MRFPTALLLCASSLWAQITQAEYAQRRAKLRASLDGAMILFAAPEPTGLHDRFFQEPNFLYLTGWREPGAALLLTPGSEILFLPPRSHTNEYYVGPRTAPGDKDAPMRTGFADVRPIAQLDRAVPTTGRIYALGGDRDAARILAGRPFQPSADAAPLIAKLRFVKSPAELALIERATRDTIDGHLAAWKRIRPGIWEYQIAATLTNVYRDRGCERDAYPPAVGSGPNGAILHYNQLSRQVRPNETIVIDVGAECNDYATDITRTVPSSGKFTPRQRELYEIALGAQKAAIAAVRPGMAFYGEKSLYKVAFDYLNTHGKDKHGEPLGKYMIHGLGHYVGLDVHDPGSYNEPLLAGSVITIEPGLYIPEENIGIRIEDVVLVTENGARVLSGSLPREVQEIEKRVGK